MLIDIFYHCLVDCLFYSIMNLFFLFQIFQLLIFCNWTRTQNNLVLKRTLNHLAKLTTFRFRACFEQGVPWRSGNYRVSIHFENAYVTWQEHTVLVLFQFFLITNGIVKMFLNTMGKIKKLKECFNSPKQIEQHRKKKWYLRYW